MSIMWRKDFLQGTGHHLEETQIPMMHSIRFTITSPYSSILFHALRHEEAPHSRIRFFHEGDTLTIECEADTIAHLRAAANSFMQWVAMVEHLIEELESK